MTPTASVVIATAGRPESLRNCLAALNADHSAVRREVLVIDNAPHDPATREVAAAAGAHWVPEPRPGKSHALNTGLHKAIGDVVLFLDDDVVVAPGWTDALTAAASRPGVGAVGGRLLPRWTAAPPAWLDGPPAVHLTLRDHGPEPRLLNPPEFPYGASLAVPAAVLTLLGADPFHPRLGPRPGRKTGHEETHLVDRIRGLGLDVRHEPEAVAEHVVDPARVDRIRLRRLVFQTGVGAARRARLLGATPAPRPVRLARTAVLAARAARWRIAPGAATAARVDHDTGTWAAFGARVEDLVGARAPRLADWLAEHLAGRGST